MSNAERKPWNDGNGNGASLMEFLMETESREWQESQRIAREELRKKEHAAIRRAALTQVQQ